MGRGLTVGDRRQLVQLVARKKQENGATLVNGQRQKAKKKQKKPIKRDHSLQ